MRDEREEGKIKGPNTANSGVRFFPRERMFTASIGCFMPFVLDAAVHSTALEDFHTLTTTVEEGSSYFPDFEYSDDFLTVAFEPLLLHNHADEPLIIDISDVQLPNLPNTIKEVSFNYERESANEPLIPVQLLDNSSAGALKGAGSSPNPNNQLDGLVTSDYTNSLVDNLFSVFNISVDNPPTAILNTPREHSMNVPGIFDGTSSSDLEGPIVKYVFDFGDGNYYSESNVSAEDGSFDGITKHTYDKPGTYETTLTVSDTKGQTSITKQIITVKNDPPNAIDDKTTTNEGSPVKISVLSNDFDINKDVISISSITSPSHGGASINPDGTITYTPDPHFNGTDIFTYTITDGYGHFSTATVQIGINPINDPPLAVDDKITTNEDTAVSIKVLNNDTDPDIALNGDVISIHSLGSASHGTVSIVSGEVLYTPDSNYNGTDTFTYTIQDKVGLLSTATVTVNIDPVNDPPVATDDNASTNEDTAVTINVLSNDSDPDIATNGDVISIKSVGTASNGITSIVSGQVQYTPDSNFNGVDTFTYTIQDKAGLTSTATVTVTIGAINDPPVAVNDSTTTNEDTPVTINVLSNDSDPDILLNGDSISIKSVGTPSNGSASIVSGQIQYTPNTNFNGVDTFTYTIQDKAGLTSTATVTVTIGAVNDPPVAINDNATTNEGTPVTINVLSNDSDPDIATNGDVITIQSVGTPSNGSASIVSGQIQYTPNTNFNGVDTFTYTIQDKAGLTSTATVTVTIGAVNDPPVAVNDSTTTNEDTPVTINVLSNDSDPDIATNGDVISIKSVGTPSNGSASIVSGQIQYTPNTNFNGVDTFTYTIQDKAGLTSTATVTVTIGAINDPPVAVNESTTTNEDTPVTINVLSNDSDPDILLNGDSISIKSVGTPSNGSASIVSGQIQYTPNTNFNGVDTFTYTIQDTTGLTSTATVTVTISPVNDPPVAVNDSTTTNEDTPVTINVLSNDSDPDVATNGDLISIKSVGTPSNGSASIVSGQIKYTPNSNFNGVDTFTYTIQDKAGLTSTATVTVTIDPINDPPVAVNDSTTTNEDTPVTINVLNNDSDPDILLNGDSISIKSVGTPSNGSASIVSGQIQYTPNTNFNGVDTFTYTIQDTTGLTSTATVTVTIGAINDPPVAVNDSVTTNEDTPVTISVLTNDSDPDIALNGDVITVKSVGTASNGSLSIVSGSTQVKYTPNTNFNGVDTFTYTIQDKAGLTSTATATVTIGAINDPPVAVNDSTTTNEDTPVTINVLSNDSDPDILLNGDSISIKSVGTPSNGSASIVSGQIQYTPNTNFNGVDTFTYTIQDTTGLTSTATVTVTISPVNDPPVAVNDTKTTNEDTAVTISVLSNDTDPDITLNGDVITVKSVGTASNGTLSIITSNTQVKYTPNSNFNGVDTFTYTIQDKAGLTSTATVTVTVTAINDAPKAVNDTRTTTEDTPISIDVLTNDTDVDIATNGDTISIKSATTPANGTTSIVSGQVLYTPKANFNGVDTFTYTIQDKAGLTSTATVTVTVTPVNDTPVGVNDSVSTNEDTAISINVLANDTDVDIATNSDVISIQSVGSASNGTTSIVAGKILYTPNLNYNNNGLNGSNKAGGTNFDTFTYTIQDKAGLTSTATVTVNVLPVNDSPVAINDNASTSEDTPLAFNVLDGTSSGGTADSDPVEGSIVTVSKFDATSKQGGTVSINTNTGATIYTPKADFNGVDTFTYQIADGDGGFSTATVTVTVNQIDDGPRPEPDIFTFNEDTVKTFTTVNLLSNDVEVDDGIKTFVSYDDSTIKNGSLSFNSGTGTFTYTPDPNYNNNGPFGLNTPGGMQYDTFTYTIKDSNGNLATSTVTLNVLPINDPPVAVNDNISINEDTVTNMNILDGSLSGGNPDSDLVEKTAISIKSVGTPVNGSVSIVNAATGEVKYTPKANFNGTDQFTYVIKDLDGGLSTGTVFVTVSPVNDLPVAVNDTYIVNENTKLTFTTGDIIKNDIEYDGENINFVSYDGSSIKNGTLSFNSGTGTFDYTPNTNYFGTETFTYVVKDDTSNFATATVTIIVNDIPVAINDSKTTLEDTPITINVAANDTDGDTKDTLTVSSVGTASNGTVTFSGANVTYTPNLNYNNNGTNGSNAPGGSGIDTFTYTVTDSKGGFSTATVTVNVTPVNDAPVAVNDNATTAEDTLVKFNVFDGTASSGVPDKDPVEGESISLVSYDAKSVAGGTVSIDGSGNVSFTPFLNFNGVDTFTYKIGDGSGGFSTATAFITVTPVNDAPTPVDDGVTTFEDTAVTFTVIPNDSDVDKDPFTVISNTNPSNGIVSFNSGTQRFTYTPNSNYNGVDTFTYTIKDPSGLTGTATVSVTVNPVNDAPVAVIDNATTAEDTPFNINVLGNDFDVDSGDSISLNSVTQPQFGTVTMNKDGTVLYTPNLDYNGVDQFTYKILDTKGAFSIGTVMVTVTPVNDSPIAVNDARTTFEDTSITINVTSNDTDVEKDALTITSLGTATHGTVQIISNQIKYTPNANYNGLDSFTYTIKDPSGLTSTATVNMSIIPLNDAPLAVTDSITTNEDTSVTIDVLTNDSDPDTALNGDTISISSSSNGAKGSTSIVAGKILYTPKADANGLDTFTYTIKDSVGLTSTATVTVTITPVQDAPVAVNDGFTASNLTVAKADTPITVNVLANDYDVDGDPLTVTSIPNSPSNGVVVINGDNTITYTPNIGYIGQDTFTYTITDGKSNFSTATVTMSVGTSNSGAPPSNDSATTPEDTAVTINVLANDVDPEGDKLTVIYTSNGSHGSTSINPDGTVVYTPNKNYFGTDSFTYRTDDGNGNFVNSIVSVTVTPVQDPPDAVNDTVTTNEDTALTINVLNNDSDPDGDIVTVVSGSVSTPSNGSAVLNGNGTITYTPKANYNGNDSFTYTVTDGNGNFDTATVNVNVASVVDSPIAVNDTVTTNEDTAASFNIFTNDLNPDGSTILLGATTSVSHGALSLDSKGNAVYTPEKDYNGLDSFTYSIFDQYGNISTATVNITVGSVNDAPVAVNDLANTNEDTAVIVNVVANDTDVDKDTLSVLSVTNGANGSVVINKDGTLTYTPNANFNGADSFTYVVKDTAGATSTATVDVAVAPINDNPTPVNDNVSTNEETSIKISVLANDTDIDGNSLVVTNVGTPTNGSVTLNPDKTITYEPFNNYSGVDTFTYTVNDGFGGSATATVTVTVNNVNDAPLAVNDTASTNQNNAVTISVLTNDTDQDLIYGDALTVKSVGTTANGGTLSIVNGSTQIQYTPKTNYSGIDTFTYTVQDKAGLTSTATVTVTISAVNQPPVAANDTATTAEDTAVTINVLSNDSDPDLGDTMSIKSVAAGAHGTTSIVSGKVLYTPTSNYNGTDTFTYTVQDKAGLTSTATVTVTVTPVNDAPTANSDSGSTIKNSPAVFSFNSLTSNDTDPDIGDTLTVASVSSPVNGVVTINFLSNSITYTPTVNFVGTGSFQYTVTDGNGGTSTATVTITVV